MREFNPYGVLYESVSFLLVFRHKCFNTSEDESNSGLFEILKSLYYGDGKDGWVGLKFRRIVQPNAKIPNYPLASRMDFIFIPIAKFEISPNEDRAFYIKMFAYLFLISSQSSFGIDR